MKAGKHIEYCYLLRTVLARIAFFPTASTVKVTCCEIKDNFVNN
jgi:hypothetical protein